MGLSPTSLTFEEVVLWFEDDLYDQLQLIQFLDWFSRQDLGRTTLSLIATDRYLGLLRPDELQRLYPGRQPVSQTQIELTRGHGGRLRQRNRTR